jgi:hypothetical protein
MDTLGLGSWFKRYSLGLGGLVLPELGLARFVGRLVMDSLRYPRQGEEP